MIHPRRDLLISLAVLGLGIIAALYAAFGPGLFDASPARQVALAIGILGVIFGSFLSYNFSLALRTARKILRGDGAIASWTMPPAQMRAFLAADTRLDGPRNLWRPREKAGERPVSIAFGPEVIVVDGAMHSIPSAGLQSMRAVSLRPWSPPMLEFSTQMVAPRSGVVGGISTIKTLLRVPAPDLASAEAVRRFYQDIIDGQTIIAPGRWTLRIKIGLWAAGLGGLCMPAGYLLAQSVNWRGDDAIGLTAMVLMIAGPLLVLGGLALALIAWRLRQIQRGKS